MYVPFNTNGDDGLVVERRMESPQVQIMNEDVLDLSVHSIGAYPCVICRRPTTFRYGSIPLCPACAEQRRL